MDKKQFIPMKLSLLKKRMLKLKDLIVHDEMYKDYRPVIDSALYAISQYRRENKVLLKKINNKYFNWIDIKSIPASTSNESPGLVKILEMQQETVERIKCESNERIELLGDQVIDQAHKIQELKESYNALENTRVEELSNKHIALIEKFNEVNTAAGIMMEQNRELKKDKMYSDSLLEKLRRWIRLAWYEIEPSEQAEIVIAKTAVKKRKLPELFIDLINLKGTKAPAQNAIIDMAYSLKEKFPDRISVNHYNHIPAEALLWLTEKNWADMISDDETMKHIRKMYGWYDLKFADAIQNLHDNLNEYVNNVFLLWEENNPGAVSSRTKQAILSWSDRDRRVKHLLEFSRKDWLKFRNVGNGTIKEITKFYNYLGIKYRQEK